MRFVWPYRYVCSNCHASVGTHVFTDIPLGSLADDRLRTKRVTSKKAFNEVLKVRGWSRKRAYIWLSVQMGIPRRSCHFAWFDDQDCQMAQLICETELQNLPEV